ncbi:hypothetical protein HBI26_247770 [Parastagonospora nodorum]|nr:hypothetical protein HBI26_247770 [Parastagonospora nodorum]
MVGFGHQFSTAPPALVKQLFHMLAADKLPCSAPIAAGAPQKSGYIKCLLEEILLIAIRICHCVTLCYLVYKHSCLLAHRPLIYIRIVPRDRLLGFDGVKGDMTRSSKVKC